VISKPEKLDMWNDGGSNWSKMSSDTMKMFYHMADYLHKR
jgi:hypothetical protein